METAISRFVVNVNTKTYWDIDLLTPEMIPSPKTQFLILVLKYQIKLAFQ